LSALKQSIKIVYHVGRFIDGAMKSILFYCCSIGANSYELPRSKAAVAQCEMGCRTNSSFHLRSVSHFRDAALLRSFRTTCSYFDKSTGTRCTRASTIARHRFGARILQ